MTLRGQKDVGGEGTSPTLAVPRFLPRCPILQAGRPDDTSSGPRSGIADDESRW